MPERSEWLVARKAYSDSDVPNQPRSPTHTDETWYNALGSSNEGVREALPTPQKYDYNIAQSSDSSIEIVVPFISYECFEKTANYRAGQTYCNYMKMLTDQLSGKYKAVENRAELCRLMGAVEKPKFSMKVDSVRLSTTPQDSRPGFFDEIPTGHAVILPSNILHGVNLVSTSWHDWKDYEIKRNVSRIVLPSGESVVCLGTIVGNWTYEDDVEGFWSSINLIVVDCKFVDSQDRQVNFMLSQSSVQAEDVDICKSKASRQLTSTDCPQYPALRCGSSWRN